MSATVDPDLTARFRAECDRLGLGSAPFGVAVSGGPDSLALLLLAAAAFPARICAATVDHRLRTEAAGEAEFVARLCERLGIPHQVLRATVDRRRSSLQRAAREARYSALARWANEQGAAVVATAHHADDQAETLMMRLLRGAGVSGLAGVRQRTRLATAGGDLVLVRPLLGWRRSELARLVDDFGLTAVSDPSNRDERYDRVQMRDRLAAAEWIDPTTLARSAGALGEAHDALEWSAERLHSECLTSEPGRIRLQTEGIPRELRRRLVLRILAELVPHREPPRGDEMSRLLDTLERGETATLAGVRCSGGSIWTFEPEPGRNPKADSEPSPGS